MWKVFVKDSEIPMLAALKGPIVGKGQDYSLSPRNVNNPRDEIRFDEWQVCSMPENEHLHSGRPEVVALGAGR